MAHSLSPAPKSVHPIVKLYRISRNIVAFSPSMDLSRIEKDQVTANLKEAIASLG